MSGPLYIPVLPARQHAAQAHRDLYPQIQERMAPLWTLPPRAPADPRTLERQLRKDIAHVTRTQRHQPAWLDAPFADQTVEPLATLLPAAWFHSPLRPVTGPERPTGQQALAIHTAETIGTGLGIRVRIPGEWDHSLVDRTRTLLHRTDPSTCHDLLLDLEAVLADRPDAGKETVRALDALIPLTEWRCAAVIGGGFPRTVEDLELGQQDEVTRHDWAMWHEVLDLRPSYRPLLRYGDYGVLAARSIAEIHQGRGGPPWGLLRYTTERNFILAKVPTRGEGRADSIRAAARRITTRDDFRRHTHSEGDRWFRSCAGGEGREGSGQASEWNRAGNNQHMTYVVRQLGGPTGLLQS